MKREDGGDKGSDVCVWVEWRLESEKKKKEKGGRKTGKTGRSEERTPSFRSVAIQLLESMTPSRDSTTALTKYAPHPAHFVRGYYCSRIDALIVYPLETDPSQKGPSN